MSNPTYKVFDSETKKEVPSSEWLGKPTVKGIPGAGPKVMNLRGWFLVESDGAVWHSGVDHARWVVQQQVRLGVARARRVPAGVLLIFP